MEPDRSPNRCQGGVIEADSGVVLRGIIVRHLVAQHRIGLERQKAMGEAGRNEDLIALLGAEQNREMPAERGRAVPDVDDHVARSTLRTLTSLTCAKGSFWK